MNLKSSLLQRTYQNPFIQWRFDVISRLAACFGTALALLCSPVHALDIRIKEGDDKYSEPLVANASGVFEFETSVAVKSLAILLNEKPVRIQKRQYYQVALRDKEDEKDIDVPGIEKPGAFIHLRPALGWVEHRDNELYEPNIKFPWQPSWTTAVDRNRDLDKRFVKLAMGCANKDASREDDSNSCYYFYMSWWEFKVWLAGATRPVTIRVRFEKGGC
ncbi:hypothetical protein [Verminephrobacter aporrectodeae]|uniref:DUF4424 domain-containing protein n=1 Tax=Verminephrobacter aporrectodeae subsp. tuberculatae TaxID=1110392 RepID=A0ABT3KYT8_9BURK|nr:hypothetical protein [Verminephrobacter aporrectodeae]MCW5323503.1 hypothetical protein [Verminephrobacter aporrectodeae subsp. tuberculatae]MCW8175166.1 hypothetical protein [Verminephrobacter aporrectodeae subsp. tuberculatae]MCW8202605.1 hypothetical protein [Verminephrobacter aporrectodeae subsp. tuberculatae]MCW8206864.1 hypothetical protein [Verminephrobacter aporrectodeae subsp. tuberculatae]